MTETVLTELIKQIELSIAHIGMPDDEYNKGILAGYQSCLETAIEMLPKEREDIEKAHYMGLIRTGENAIFPLDKKVKYFNTTFTQYKPVNNE